MGHATVSAITGNMEASLAAQGLNVTSRALDAARPVPAGMMPLAVVACAGEEFEDRFGERPGHADARFTITVVIAERSEATAADEEQRLAHLVRGALSVDALNGGALASQRPVVRVKVPGYGVERTGGFSRITVEVSARYREQ